MKKITIALVVAITVTFTLAPEARAKKPDKKDPKAKPAEKEEAKQKKLFQIFRESFKDFGKNNTHKVKIISGPTPVKMRNGRVPGKMWRATCGKYRFKLTIEDKTKLPLATLIKRVEELPMPYLRACEVVSDEGEDGLAIYSNLNGAMAHGGKGYINTVPHAPSVVIAHEVGHTLEQAARESDPKLIEKWGAASKSDKQSVSGYGDSSDSENLAEFAKVYAVCLDKGPKRLAELKNSRPGVFRCGSIFSFAPRRRSGPGASPSIRATPRAPRASKTTRRSSTETKARGIRIWPLSTFTNPRLQSTFRPTARPPARR